MFNTRNYFDSDKQRINKIRQIQLQTEMELLDEVDQVTVESLDDVFGKFEILINVHPYYANNIHLSNLHVKAYLKKNFENQLSQAIKKDDKDLLKEICVTIGKVYAPKEYSYFRRKREERSLSYAFNSLLEQYRLCTQQV